MRVEEEREEIITINKRFNIFVIKIIKYNLNII